MKSLLKLKPYLKVLWPYILGSTLLAVPLSLLRVSPIQLIRYLMDQLLVSHDKKKLLLFAGMIIGLYALNFVVRFFHYYLLRVAVARTQQKLQNDVCQHFMGLSSEYFTSRSVGQMSSRAISDPQALASGLSGINVIIREPITLICLLIATFYLNWRLTLVTLCLIPVLAWVFSRTGKHSKRYSTSILDANAGVFSVLQEALGGFRVIQLFGLQKYVHKRFRRQTDAYLKSALKAAVLEEVSPPTVELLGSFAVAAVIYFGGREVIRGHMSSGDLLAFFTAFLLMVNPVRMLNDVHMKLNQSAGAADRIFDLLSWESRITSPAFPSPIPSEIQSIEFQNVSFAYPDAPQELVLRDISLDIPRGQIVALVGASGAGKSSVASLLPRLYDVNSGSIKMNGRDLRDYDPQELRSLISVVSQDVFLFNDTIEENIRAGKRSATFEEIVSAAQKANALSFIERFPKGFKTHVGERGQKLSGGERQRISIARAFLRQSPLLILDEATSNLDAESERAVQESLKVLMVNRTTLVIAHRLSTIRKADQIVVLKRGKIVERGTHDSLILTEGDYALFHRLSQSEASLGQA